MSDNFVIITNPDDVCERTAIGTFVSTRGAEAWAEQNLYCDWEIHPVVAPREAAMPKVGRRR